MSFPPGNKMFQFPGYRPLAGDHGSHDRVPPFGNQRINACLQLPVAYRSKPRPSSPVDAWASPVRSYLLDHITSRISNNIQFSYIRIISNPNAETYVSLALDLSYGFLLDISHKLSQHTPRGMCLLDEIFNYI